MFRAREPAGEDLLLEVLELGLERLEHREVAVDDGVHQRVQHEPRSMAQQLGLALAARADVREAALGAAADREHVVRAGEDVHLADAQVLPLQLDGVQHDEERVAVLLDLRPLVAVCASSTASSCRWNSSCIASSSPESGSYSATQTKQSGRFTYSEISLRAMSASLRPF